MTRFIFCIKKKKKKTNRHNFAPYGLIPPHTHSRAREILVVLEGSIRWVRHIQPQ
jgi:quercetin dioxygenase-like cupin family protein